MATGRIGSFANIKRGPSSPMRETGVSGVVHHSGYLASRETNPKLIGPTKWLTAADILVNTAIVGAGVRFYLNLIADAQWTVQPAIKDSREAQEYADFVESCRTGMTTSWAKIVRRSALYLFHGFSIQEWTAIKRDSDGAIGFKDIESRPQHTIERWDIDESGTLLGVGQVSPQTSQELYIPRSRMIYLVDDALTDSPDGIGWFRHLAEPNHRLRGFLKLEAIGLQRDLSGVPIGRAPLTKLDEMVTAGQITEDQKAAALATINKFLRAEIKMENTSILFDSQLWESMASDGPKVSSTPMWGVELLNGSTTSLPALANAIDRELHEMARIIGVENLLVGAQQTGSLALAADKTQTMFLGVNSALRDIGESFSRDTIDPLWTLNSFPPEMKPKLVPDKASFADVKAMVDVLEGLSRSGAVIMPDDPAINAIREAQGLPPQPEIDAELAGALARTRPPEVETEPEPTDDEETDTPDDRGSEAA